MDHSYDFVLQPKEPQVALDASAVVATLMAKGATQSPDGRLAWKLPEGEVTVVVLKESGADHGIDVRVPYREKTTLLEAVIRELVELAEAHALKIGDPQRGEFAGFANLPTIAEEYVKMARYAGEYGGVSEAVGLSSYSEPLSPETSTFRGLAIVVVGALALYVGFRFVTTRRASEADSRNDAAVKVRKPGQPPR